MKNIYSHSSFTLLSFIHFVILKNKQKNKYVCILEITINHNKMKTKLKKDHTDTTYIDLQPIS